MIYNLMEELTVMSHQQNNAWTWGGATYIEVFGLEAYVGNQYTLEIENFLWDLDQWFKINIAS